MKRLTAMLLILLLIPGLWACDQEEEFASPVKFYYLRAPLPNGEVMHGTVDSVIVPEIREGDGHLDNAAYLLDLYLMGPLNDVYRSPYPAGTRLKDFVLEDGVATIMLTDNFASLTDVDLSLACGCLTLTVMDLSGAVRVTIRVESETLDGKASITMDRDNLILIDNTPVETD